MLSPWCLGLQETGFSDGGERTADGGCGGAEDAFGYGAREGSEGKHVGNGDGDGIGDDELVEQMQVQMRGKLMGNFSLSRLRFP